MFIGYVKSILFFLFGTVNNNFIYLYVLLKYRILQYKQFIRKFI